MPWYDAFAPLPSIVSELRGIREQLTRLADAAEGKLPPIAEVPEAEPEPPSIAGPQSDADFAKVEEIEQRWLTMGGRLPTAEEICRELDGEETPPEVLRAEFERRQRIGVDSPHAH